MAAAPKHALSDSSRRDAQAFGEALFARTLDEAPPAERMRWFVDDLDDFVAHLNLRARWLFLFCLFAVTWVAPLLAGHLGRLRGLSVAGRIAALEALEQSPASLALFGARAVVSLVYYEHPDAAAEIGWDRRCLADVRPERVAASRLVPLGRSGSSAEGART
ncbi:MAG: hypothetical protein K1X94_08350 [Sandaracinaceae bacterium]|nr:hypothetical protein [Sandaracinaceae bacterium]